jgi:hypothetical protein
MKIKLRIQHLPRALLVGLVLLLVPAVVVLAAGNIDINNRSAWGTNAGWINFQLGDNGGVTVYSDHLEGYAWGENIGWIRLGTCTGGSPCSHANDAAGTYGVNNDGVGNLSGYAWATNVGWINFDPANGGVTIDPVTGDFDGYAWGENIGWIRFRNDSADYKVMTSWHGDLLTAYQYDIAAIITTRRPGPASSGGLSIANVNFLNDPGDGIIFGHQNGTGTTNADCPTGVTERWQRLWEFDTNDGAGTTGGTVTLTFDFSDAGFGTTPSGAYTLLKRSGTSGAFTGIATSPGPHTGDQVVFSNVSVADLGSYFTLGSGTPTAVKLVSFEVVPHDEALLVTWETAQELDNVGFNLYRSTAFGGPYTLLNDTLIPPQFPGEVLGGLYEWLDSDVQPDIVYYYQLEDIDVKGVSTFHGPVSTSLVTGPTAVHLQRIAARSALMVLLPLVTGIVAVLGLSVARRRRR